MEPQGDLSVQLARRVHLLRAARLVVGSLALDERFLRSLDDGSELVVTAKLKASQVLPNELIERKVIKIGLSNGILCREENAETLLPRLVRRGGSELVTVVPVGYELVERALVLTPGLLAALPTRRPYCTDQVRIAEDVTAVEHLVAVHNLGRITGTADQVAALEFLLRTSEGDLRIVSPEEEKEPETEAEDEESYEIGNIVNLKL